MSITKLESNIKIKIIGLIKRLPVGVSGKSLLSIYKSFIRPHLGYGDIKIFKTY